MVTHFQKSDRTRIYYDAEITEAAGALTIPKATIWVEGKEYALPAYKPSVGSSAFRIWVEKTQDGADYMLDTTLDAEPAYFRPNVALRVAWRDVDGAVIHLLRHVPDAA